MASAFLNFAARSAFKTARNTSYHIRGLVLLNAGSQFCYAYNTVAELAGSKFWKACGRGGASAGSSVGGCCPANLTEDYCKSASAKCSHINLMIHIARMLRQRVLLLIDDTLLADWRNPHEYPHHPPTLLVQSLADYNADIDAARFYHQVLPSTDALIIARGLPWLVRMRHYANAMCGVPYC